TPSTQSMMCAATGANCAPQRSADRPDPAPGAPAARWAQGFSLRTRDVADRKRASRADRRADAQCRHPVVHRASDITSAFASMRRRARISRGLSCRIDHLLDFSDLGRRKAAHLGMFADDGLVLGEIDAKGLVVGHVALDPLNVRTELTQDLVRFCRRPSQLFALQRADIRNIPFDDEFAQRHRSPPLLGNVLPSYGRLGPCWNSRNWATAARKDTTKALSRSERGSAQHSHTSRGFESLAWGRSRRAESATAIATLQSEPVTTIPPSAPRTVSRRPRPCSTHAGSRAWPDRARRRRRWPRRGASAGRTARRR